MPGRQPAGAGEQPRRRPEGTAPAAEAADAVPCPAAVGTSRDPERP